MTQAATIDRFVPLPDVRELHESLVRAPAGEVFTVAEQFDLWSLPAAHDIFRLRELLLRRAGAAQPRRSNGLVAEAQALGWGILARTSGREVVLGAVARPWMAGAACTAMPPGEFERFSHPDLVKIAWTLEVDPEGPALTRLRTETRVVATDESARRKFRRYWRRYGVGIVAFRWLGVSAMRQEAERRYRAQRAGRVSRADRVTGIGPRAHPRPTIQ
jgi:hypothetical protein